MIQKEIKPRQGIFKALSNLFHYQGYNPIGVNQIVQKSGVGKSIVPTCIFFESAVIESKLFPNT